MLPGARVWPKLETAVFKALGQGRGETGLEETTLTSKLLCFSSIAVAMAAAAATSSELAHYLEQHHGLSVTLSPTKGRCLVAHRPFQRGSNLPSPTPLQFPPSTPLQSPPPSNPPFNSIPRVLQASRSSSRSPTSPLWMLLLNPLAAIAAIANPLLSGDAALARPSSTALSIARCCPSFNPPF